MTRANIVIGGTQHKSATSFTPKKIAQYEKEKLYRPQGIAWVCPSRGQIHTSVVVSWLSLQWPPNHFRTSLIVAEGMEVGEAYNSLFGWTMDRKALRKTLGKEYGDAVADSPFVFTSEEDNVLPSETIPILIKAIYACPECGGEVGGDDWVCEDGHHGYDAVSGLYFMKTNPPVPMAFGTPNGSRKIDFKPNSIAKAIRYKKVQEVNGIAMGCALWRKSLFQKVSKPWFQTTPNFTQDLFFCKKAKIEAKARFGVHAGLKVAHFNHLTKQFF